jgi:hypothetical protein
MADRDCLGDILPGDRGKKNFERYAARVDVHDGEEEGCRFGPF